MLFILIFCFTPYFSPFFFFFFFFLGKYIKLERTYTLKTQLYDIKVLHVYKLSIQEVTPEREREREMTREMDWKPSYLDLILVPLGFLISISYHVWLWHKVQTDPLSTTIGRNAHGRRFWVGAMMKVYLYLSSFLPCLFFFLLTLPLSFILSYLSLSLSLYIYIYMKSLQKIHQL
jgi:hypothetical protein